MTGVTNILVGPGDPKTLHPDAGEKKTFEKITFIKFVLTLLEFGH